MKTPKHIELSKSISKATLYGDGSLSLFEGESYGIFVTPKDFENLIKEREKYLNSPLQSPELPEGESWHNPDNLTPEQVEVDKGWRLLTKSERGNRAYSGDCIYDCSGWGGLSESWGPVILFGASRDITYRTKAPYLSSSDKAQEPEINAERSQSIDLIGKRHTAGFLRKCRVITMHDPLSGDNPFFGGPMITLFWGKKEGHGEINPDMEYESYLDGKTYPVRNIVNIVP